MSYEKEDELMDLLRKYEKDLVKFCRNNGISYEKLKQFPRCGNESVLFIQHYDPKDTGTGLINNTPAEIVLSVIVGEDGNIIIEEGENLRNYLEQ